MLNSSSEAVVVTEQGLVIKTRSVEHQESARVGEMGHGQNTWNTSRSVVPRMAVTMAFDIQVGMERPAEVVPRDPGE